MGHKLLILHNAGVTGRFVERQRNKPVRLTHLLADSPFNSGICMR
jgi:hypothetical protein